MQTPFLEHFSQVADLLRFICMLHKVYCPFRLDNADIIFCYHLTHSLVLYSKRLAINFVAKNYAGLFLVSAIWQHIIEQRHVAGIMQNGISNMTNASYFGFHSTTVSNIKAGQYHTLMLVVFTKHSAVDRVYELFIIFIVTKHLCIGITSPQSLLTHLFQCTSCWPVIVALRYIPLLRILSSSRDMMTIAIVDILKPVMIIITAIKTQNLFIVNTIKHKSILSCKIDTQQVNKFWPNAG